MSDLLAMAIIMANEPRDLTFQELQQLFAVGFIAVLVIAGAIRYIAEAQRAKVLEREQRHRRRRPP
jgi:hypothetical protein